MNPVTIKPGILVVDDEPELLRVLGLILRDAGYQVHEAIDGKQGVRQALRIKPDLIILDLMLPDIPGSEVTRQIREASAIPILMLSSSESPAEKVRALDAGADDFITKPFDPDELLARIRATLRRKISNRDEDVLVVGDLRLERSRKNLLIGGREVLLTKTEFALLELFSRNLGKLLSHERILREIWGAEADSRREYLRVYVSNLRKKTSVEGFRCPVIETRSSIGYRLILE
jgi:two-component system KDP operon response regulator KdpE